MPFKKENYPANWEQISYEVKARAGFCCQKCGAPDKVTGIRTPTGSFLAWTYQILTIPEAKALGKKEGLPLFKVVLAAAHLDQDTSHNEWENLQALCQHCHLNHDRPVNQRTLRERRHKGQLSIFHQVAQEAEVVLN